jgi:xanthine dehydrogenase iron-sulfur cluster and FAD-binding subunit A
VPFTTANQHVEAYKQARRRDDDIALANGCLFVELVGGAVAGAAPTISTARLAFGGMARTIVSAGRAEALLAGKVWCQDVADAAMAELEVGGTTLVSHTWGRFPCRFASFGPISGQFGASFGPVLPSS